MICMKKVRFSSRQEQKLGARGHLALLEHSHEIPKQARPAWISWFALTRKCLFSLDDWKLALCFLSALLIDHDFVENKELANIHPSQRHA